MKGIVIIPAYNEEANIFNVIMSIKKYQPDMDIIVINDCSTDRTSLEAKRADAKIIDLPYNMGIGGAVQTGYIYALDNSYDVAVQIDGDGQHDPQDLNQLLHTLLHNQADMVIGSRFVGKTGYKAGMIRSIGICYFSRLVSFLCKKSYYDTTSGYRAVNAKCMRMFVMYYPVDYPEVETIVYAVKNGIRVKEIEVKMKQRQGGQSSITLLKSIYYMIKVTLALLFQFALYEEVQQ